MFECGSGSIAFGALREHLVGFCIAMVRRTTSVIDNMHLLSSPLPARPAPLRNLSQSSRAQCQVPAGQPLQNMCAIARALHYDAHDVITPHALCKQHLDRDEYITASVPLV